MPHFASNPPQNDPVPLVWAFLPFWVQNGKLMGDSYDTAQFKAELALVFHELGLPWIWQPVTQENLGAIIAQVLESARQRPVVVFNCCDGVDDPDDAPGLSVVRALEAAGLPFTGASAEFFAISTSKLEMKALFSAAGVATPGFRAVANAGPVVGIAEAIPGPLFFKPDISAASYGISLRSVMATDAEILAYRDELKTGPFAQIFANAPFFVEQYIQGPEFTVFVGGDWRQPEQLWGFPPVLRAFHGSIPAHERFLSFDRYWGYYQEESAPPDGERFYWYERCPAELAADLTGLARRAYCTVRGHGYGRVDIRQDEATGALYVLEVNANCGLSGDDQTSMGNILELGGSTFPALIRKLLVATGAQWAQGCQGEANA